MSTQERPRASILTLILAVIIVWLLYLNYYHPTYNPDAEPKAVTARGDLAADESNTIDIFKTVSPSVVYITSIEYRRGLFSMDVYQIPKGTGSGFIWDKDGRIVTNYHVIEDASQVKVTLSDQTTWKAKLVGVAPDKDLAVLQINAPASKLTPIMIGHSKTLQVGQKVFAIGNPFGLDHTMTSGIVSALGREIKSATDQVIQDVIQTDAAINPGNSGGPLLDSASRLIGVNTAIYSASGSSAGIGFAVPVDIVNRVVPDIIRHGKVIRPQLGISIATASISERLKIDGVLIINVQVGSSADRAGLKGTQQSRAGIVLGDIIQSIDAKPIHDFDDLRNVLDQYRSGDEVMVGVLRDEKRVQLKVTLD